MFFESLENKKKKKERHTWNQDEDLLLTKFQLLHYHISSIFARSLAGWLVENSLQEFSAIDCNHTNYDSVTCNAMEGGKFIGSVGCCVTLINLLSLF